MSNTLFVNQLEENNDYQKTLDENMIQNQLAKNMAEIRVREEKIQQLINQYKELQNKNTKQENEINSLKKNIDSLIEEKNNLE